MLALLGTATVSAHATSPAIQAPDWKPACAARLSAARDQLAKRFPEFKKGRVTIERAKKVRFSLIRAEQEFNADAEQEPQARDTPWHDPGFGDSTPDLQLQRELGHRSAGLYAFEDRDLLLRAFERTFKAALDFCLTTNL